MTSEFLISALATISVLTSLTVEAIKRLLNEKNISYSSNLLAAVVAVILAVCVSVCYVVYMSIQVTPQIVVSIIAISFLSFLTSTISFDKVKQLFEQINR